LRGAADCHPLPEQWSTGGCPVGFDSAQTARSPAGPRVARARAYRSSSYLTAFPNMAFFGNDAVNRVNIHYAIKAAAQGAGGTPRGAQG
jgi:hypothetical protein